MIASSQSLIIDLVGNIDTLNSVSYEGKLGNKGEVGKSDKIKLPNITINLHHIGVYQDLFAQIDNCLKRYPVYTYNGLKGSAASFASVFMKQSFTPVQAV